MLALPAVYPILDAEMAAEQGHDLVACARAFADMGMDVQQLRAKTLASRDVYQLAARLAVVVPRLIVNDRPDIARLAGAAGVHLGQNDLPPAAARALEPSAQSWIVGISTHTSEQLGDAAASAPDYIALGPISSTTSKLNPDPVVGTAGLTEARRIYAGPLVAIGGLNLKSAPRARAAGADSVAVISVLWRAPDPIAAARELLLACA